MKKVLIMISAAMLLAGCTQAAKASATAEAASVSTAQAAQLAAPFHEVESLEDAEKETGMTIAAPDELNHSNHRTIQVFDDGMIDIIYRSGEEETARVRKMKGSSDISGDYNEYASVAEQDGKTYKGDGNSVSLVIWSDNGYSYALSFTGGVDEETAEKTAAEIE